MRHNPERVAWTVLLSSFFACVALASLSIWASQWWVMNATQPQLVRLSASGTVLVRPPGRTEDVANPEVVPVGSLLSTEPGAQATLDFYAPDGVTVLTNLTIYGNTRITVAQADSPRFDISPHDHAIRLIVEFGRVRAKIGLNTSRPVKVDLLSEPQTWTILQQPGSNASIEVGATRTTATVREGEAIVVSVSQSKSITLTKDQRAEVLPNTPIAGPLPAERNLISNGDFSGALAPNWTIDLRQPKQPDDDVGQILPLTRDGRPAVKFYRAGQDWGQIGITQVLDRDISDFQSLRLQLDVYIAIQNLFNCGEVGTECPVMVKLKYVDINGNEQEWLQGFYANPNPSVATVCVTCPEPRPAQHEQVSLNQWTTFESENLLEAFNAANLKAAFLKSITVYASGHTFESLVTDVQLLVTE